MGILRRMRMRCRVLLAVIIAGIRGLAVRTRPRKPSNNAASTSSPPTEVQGCLDLADTECTLPKRLANTTQDVHDVLDVPREMNTICNHHDGSAKDTVSPEQGSQSSSTADDVTLSISLSDNDSDCDVRDPEEDIRALVVHFQGSEPPDEHEDGHLRFLGSRYGDDHLTGGYPLNDLLAATSYMEHDNVTVIPFLSDDSASYDTMVSSFLHVSGHGPDPPESQVSHISIPFSENGEDYECTPPNTGLWHNWDCDYPNTTVSMDENDHTWLRGSSWGPWPRWDRDFASGVLSQNLDDPIAVGDGLPSTKPVFERDATSSICVSQDMCDERETSPV